MARSGQSAVLMFKTVADPIRHPQIELNNGLPKNLRPLGDSLCRVGRH